ncbi:unnamed protein product [Prunus armeniaca]|uniref:Uncharacterized protein n=1 Tax=Prunus armeniaca TaxID=36596 RepID=A0A6J5UAI0_PRUAR|nr:hypothetical protein GBA52_015296 [Prunus armeniaca]CAB4272135.1 unnamed protein product [Prunus armeniaca]CAB4302775.1 unnamed protein product [Prunus armeniaca]
MNHSSGLYLPPRPETDPQRGTHPLRAREGNEVQLMGPRRSGAAATRSDGCVTFGVVVRAPVPNGRMSDPFPCGSWLYHSVPDGRRGIRYSSSRSFALRVPAELDTC